MSFPNQSSENQVQPFSISTPDGETLYVWHVLPITKYTAHEEALVGEPSNPPGHFTDTIAFDLLSKDPTSRLVINCPLLAAIAEIHAKTR